MVTFDAADYSPEAAKAVRAWFAERKGRIYYAGPLIPHGKDAEANELKQSQQSEKIVRFLDEKLASHGERSVIYVSRPVIHSLRNLDIDDSHRSPSDRCSGLRTMRNFGQY